MHFLKNLNALHDLTVASSAVIACCRVNPMLSIMAMLPSSHEFFVDVALFLLGLKGAAKSAR